MLKIEHRKLNQNSHNNKNERPAKKDPKTLNQPLLDPPAHARISFPLS